MKPQDYSARTAYRRPATWYRRLNWLGVLLTSAGLAPRDAVTLQVRGRRSGKDRRVPILRTRCQGEDYLVALAGESQWVRNVRAAGGRAVIRRRAARPVTLEEVAPAERPEIIAEYLRAAHRRSGTEAAARQARYYFGLPADASIDDVRAVADHYPVFRIRYAVREGLAMTEIDNDALRDGLCWGAIGFGAVATLAPRAFGGVYGLTDSPDMRVMTRLWGTRSALIGLAVLGAEPDEARRLIRLALGLNVADALIAASAGSGATTRQRVLGPLSSAAFAAGCAAVLARG